MVKSEKEYKDNQKKMQKLQKEAETLGKRIEPYWDSKTKGIKKDAPDDVKKDYERFLEIFEELETDL